MVALEKALRCNATYVRVKLGTEAGWLEIQREVHTVVEFKDSDSVAEVWNRAAFAFHTVG